VNTRRQAATRCEKRAARPLALHLREKGAQVAVRHAAVVAVVARANQALKEEKTESIPHFKFSRHVSPHDHWHLKRCGNFGGVHSVLFHHILLSVNLFNICCSQQQATSLAASPPQHTLATFAPAPLFTRSCLFRKAPQPAVQLQVSIRVRDAVRAISNPQFNLISVVCKMELFKTQFQH
jgi:hypothetical protein